MSYLGAAGQRKETQRRKRLARFGVGGKQKWVGGGAKAEFWFEKQSCRKRCWDYYIEDFQCEGKLIDLHDGHYNGFVNFPCKFWSKS